MIQVSSFLILIIDQIQISIEKRFLESWSRSDSFGTERLLHQFCPEGVALPKTGDIKKEISLVAYILKSLKDQKYYYRSTKNLEQRLKDHNKGKVRSTKGRRPLIVHYFEEFDNIQDACNEKFILRVLMSIVG